MKKLVYVCVWIFCISGLALGLGSAVSPAVYQGVMYSQGELQSATVTPETAHFSVTFGASGTYTWTPVPGTSFAVSGNANATVNFCSSYSKSTKTLLDRYHRYQKYYVSGNSGLTNWVHISDYNI